MDQRPLLSPAAEEHGGGSRNDESSSAPPSSSKDTGGGRSLGTFGTLMQIFRLYCGTGLLAFPYAVKCGGLVAAPIVLLFIGFLNNYTLKMLVWSKRRLMRQLPGSSADADYVAPAAPASLDDLAFAAFGQNGRRFCAIAMVVSLLGLCSGYLIFVGSTLRVAFGSPAWAKYSLGGALECNVFTVIATLLVLPLTLVRNYNRVRWSGILGNVALITAVGVVTYHLVDHVLHSDRHFKLSQVPHRRLEWGGDGGNSATVDIAGQSSSSVVLSDLVSASSSLDLTVDAPSPSSLPQNVIIENVNLEALPVFLGLIFFAFAFHGVILGVDSVAAEPKKFTKNLDRGAVLGVATYLAFGCLGYYAYGKGVSQIIFASILPPTLDLRIVEVLFCLSMILLFPLQMLPVIQIFERWFNISNVVRPPRRGIGTERRIGTAFSPIQSPDIRVRHANDLADGPVSCIYLKENAVRVFTTLVAGGLAVVFGEVFSQVLSIVGALGFSLLSFVLPPLIYLKIMRKDMTLRDRVFTVFILLVGIVGMGVSSVVDMNSIINYFEGGDTDPCRA